MLAFTGTPRAAQNGPALVGGVSCSHGGKGVPLPHAPLELPLSVRHGFAT
jgi:hypothetical protein